MKSVSPCNLYYCTLTATIIMQDALPLMTSLGAWMFARDSNAENSLKIVKKKLCSFLLAACIDLLLCSLIVHTFCNKPSKKNSPK